MTSAHLSRVPEYAEAELEDSCATLLALELLRPAVAADPRRTEQLAQRIRAVGQRIAELRDRHGSPPNPVSVGCVFAMGTPQPRSSSQGSGLE